MKRRGFLLGLGAALAAPAIVRAEVLMPVRSLVMPPAPSILTLNGNTLLTTEIIAKEALRILRANPVYWLAANGELMTFVEGRPLGAVVRDL